MKDTPKVIVVAETFLNWFIVCPHCREIHAHSKEYGHRMSHCTNKTDKVNISYDIVKEIN